MPRTSLAVTLIALSGVLLGYSLRHARAANAVEVKLLSAEVMKPALTELAVAFERKTGYKLSIRYDSAGKVRTRIQGGESADVVLLQKPAAAALAEQGQLTNIVTLARSGVGLAVRKGVPKPDIRSVAALKRALLAAKSIAYPDPGRGAASGIHFRNVIERLGIAEEVNAKAKLMRGTLSDFVTESETEIAITQPMEILAEPSYDLVGWLPDELQDYKNFTWAVAITANAKESAAAQALVQFLSSPTAARVIKKRGMKPVG
jgi:molybdate transport system substrate-binding protein